MNWERAHMNTLLCTYVLRIDYTLWRAIWLVLQDYKVPAGHGSRKLGSPIIAAGLESDSS